jgi:hypothetical protein
LALAFLGGLDFGALRGEARFFLLGLALGGLLAPLLLFFLDLARFDLFFERLEPALRRGAFPREVLFLAALFVSVSGY